MTSDYHRVVFVFVDGIGLDHASDRNPFTGVPTPEIHSLLDGDLTLEQCGCSDHFLLAPIDACLGVDGLPQSATGQAALFTGINAAERMGRHVTGLPGPRVRAIVEAGNLFSSAVEAGLAATFANAYTDTYLESVEEGRRQPSVTTCAVASSGLEFRMKEDLQSNRAISWDIVRDRFVEHVGGNLQEISALEAGHHLAAVGSENRLTVYETFITDMAGHERLGFTPEDALARIDGLIGGLTRAMDGNTTIVMTSDHGNLEDRRHRRHTRNPVPLLVIGPLASEFAGVESILEVTPRILTCLQVSV